MAYRDERYPYYDMGIDREYEEDMRYSNGRRDREMSDFERYYPHENDRGDYNMHERTRSYRGRYGDNPFYLEQTDYPYDMRENEMRDMARGRRGGSYNRRGGSSRRRDRRDYADYASNEKTLEHWKKKLHKHLDDSEKEIFKIEKIIKRASDMRIAFEDFSEDEFYVTVLMIYTDYKPSLGKGNADVYIRLAKDFLCDEDASVKYGEKLMAYYDAIVEGEDD